VERELPGPPQCLGVSQEQQLEGFIVGVMPKGSKHIFAVKKDELLGAQTEQTEEAAKQEDEGTAGEQEEEEEERAGTAPVEDMFMQVAFVFFVMIHTASYEHMCSPTSSGVGNPG